MLPINTPPEIRIKSRRVVPKAGFVGLAVRCNLIWSLRSFVALPYNGNDLEKPVCKNLLELVLPSLKHNLGFPIWIVVHGCHGLFFKIFCSFQTFSRLNHQFSTLLPPLPERYVGKAGMKADRRQCLALNSRRPGGGLQTFWLECY
jgi:hypothetical protein